MMTWKTFRIVYTAFRAEKLETADRSGVFAASSGRCFPMDGDKGTHEAMTYRCLYRTQTIKFYGVGWFGPRHFLVHLMSDALGIFLSFLWFFMFCQMLVDCVRFYNQTSMHCVKPTGSCAQSSESVISTQ
jgi:hypothetical protein